MRQATHRIAVASFGRGLLDITDSIRSWTQAQGVQSGLLTLFLQHTSASLVIQENADPDVLCDLDAFLSRLAPDDPSLYRHVMEGPDDMPAHIRAALTQSHLAIPVIEGALSLGVWQGIYLFEHRLRAHKRTIALHLIGE